MYAPPLRQPIFYQNTGLFFAAQQILKTVGIPNLNSGLKKKTAASIGYPPTPAVISVQF